MKVLVIGSTGLIGQALSARLEADGHSVVRLSRCAKPPGIRLDLSQVTSPRDWLPHLQGLDAVVNCAGVLQDSGTDSTDGVHHRAVAALFKACEEADVRRGRGFRLHGNGSGRPADHGNRPHSPRGLFAGRRLDCRLARPLCPDRALLASGGLDADGTAQSRRHRRR